VRLGPATICPMRLTLVHFDAEQLRLTGHPPPPPAAAGCWLLAAARPHSSHPRTGVVDHVAVHALPMGVSEGDDDDTTAAAAAAALGAAASLAQSIGRSLVNIPAPPESFNESRCPRHVGLLRFRNHMMMPTDVHLKVVVGCGCLRWRDENRCLARVVC
jgi:hypothetical protein